MGHYFLDTRYAAFYALSSGPNWPVILRIWPPPSITDPSTSSGLGPDIFIEPFVADIPAIGGCLLVFKIFDNKPRLLKSFNVAKLKKLNLERYKIEHVRNDKFV